MYTRACKQCQMLNSDDLILWRDLQTTKPMFSQLLCSMVIINTEGTSSINYSTRCVFSLID